MVVSPWPTFLAHPVGQGLSQQVEILYENDMVVGHSVVQQSNFPTEKFISL